MATETYFEHLAGEYGFAIHADIDTARKIATDNLLDAENITERIVEEIDKGIIYAFSTEDSKPIYFLIIK